MLTFLNVYLLVGLGYILGGYETYVKVGSQHSAIVNMLGLTFMFLTWPYTLVKTVLSYSAVKDYHAITEEIVSEIIKARVTGEEPGSVLTRIATKHKLNSYDKGEIEKILAPVLMAKSAELLEDEDKAANA